uniref:hypothetical protein n=1 Tax=Desulfosarcina sp. TaxID=2027861 RepID=UPI0035620885
MNNKRWTAVAGVILLAGIVASIIFFQQRNDARQRWGESREQIAELDRRNEELKALLENQKSHLSAEAALAQKKQAALTAVETQVTELKARLDQGQAELDTANEHLRQITDETERLKRVLATAQETAADHAGERDRLEAERKKLVSRMAVMEGEDTKRGAIIAALESRVAEQETRIASLDKKSR